MSESLDQPPEKESKVRGWLGPTILSGIFYSVIGVLFALPTQQGRTWRLAAWIVCGFVFAAHIAFEQLRLRKSSPTTALHAALAAAIGGFGLAVAANVHELWVGPHYRRSLALAFVAWPLLTGLPAFIVALIAAYGLALIRRRAGSHG